MTFPLVALSEGESGVHAEALQILQERGFQYWFNEESALYWAERDGWDFTGPDPLALLGIVMLYEEQLPAQWKEYWWRVAQPRSDLSQTPRPYHSVTRDSSKSDSNA